MKNDITKLHIRLRFIKNPSCKCPCPPYLNIIGVSRFPYIRFYWGGIICMCDIIDILDNIHL